VFTDLLLPYRKHRVSITKTNRLLMFKETIAACEKL